MTRHRSMPGPTGLRIYLQAILGAGLLVLVASIVGAVHTPQPLWWMSMAAFAIAVGSFRLNFTAVSANISIDDTFFITIALLFGPAPATLALALSSMLVSWRRRMPVVQTAFNIASTAISLWAGAKVFF